eukprot:UN03277
MRDSLGGNCFTTIIVTASAHEYNRNQTLSTLRFAETAKKITNKVEVNRILSRADMQRRMNELQDQINYLNRKKKDDKKKGKTNQKQSKQIKSLQNTIGNLEIGYAEKMKELIETKQDIVRIKGKIKPKRNNDKSVDTYNRRRWNKI